MALAINQYQKELGKLLGLKEVNSEKDLKQINEFANYHQVKNVNSARDVRLLSPLVGDWLSKKNAPPPAPGALPNAAAQGQAGPDAMKDLLMQQSSGVQQQETYFDQLLKQQQLEQQQQTDQVAAIQKQYEAQQAAQQAEFAKQQETWNQELLAQQQAQAAAKAAEDARRAMEAEALRKTNNSINAAGSAPGAIAGWTPNPAGIQELEKLLMGSSAKTNALASFSTMIA